MYLVIVDDFYLFINTNYLHIFFDLHLILFMKKKVKKT